MNSIEFDDISKLYRLGKVGTGTLYGDLNRWWTMNVLHREDPYLKFGQKNRRNVSSSSDFVWALRDINLNVPQGEVLGIIGGNGAGKSTLLKILSGITAPTTGTVRIKGRIGSLLEVGTGFHPEMTGRENIYMNGAILGMTRQEIKSRLDEIIDFSGCERYIDTPVKRYSSGMLVRLAFAVAAHLNPEILVVDEVLAVGDAEFQQKAIGKMEAVSRGEGRTVLFVSHNMESVKRLCTRGVLLKDGMMDHIGSVSECIERYTRSDDDYVVGKADVGDSHRRQIWPLGLQIMHAEMAGDPSWMSTDDPLDIVLTLRRNDLLIKDCQYTVMIYTSGAGMLMQSFTDIMDVPSDKETFRLKLHLENLGLPKGNYRLGFSAGIKHFPGRPVFQDRVVDVLSFKVRLASRNPRIEYTGEWRAPYEGYVVHQSDQTIKGSIVQEIA